MCLVDDNNKLTSFGKLYITLLGRLVKTTEWPKILECRLMKSESDLKLLKDKIHFFDKQLGPRSFACIFKIFRAQSCLTVTE